MTMALVSDGALVARAVKHLGYFKEVTIGFDFYVFMFLKNAQ